MGFASSTPAAMRPVGTETEGLMLLLPLLSFLVLLPRLGGKRLRLAPLLLEGRVIPAIEAQTGPVEMDDMRRRRIEQIAVMADDDRAGGIAREIIDEPQRPSRSR